MSEKFTKGPWYIAEEDWEAKGDITVIYNNDGEEVLGIIGYIKIDEPDLQLIAAAPDMYEALEEVWRILDSTMPLSRDNRADRIKRILRKARGEEE